MIRFILLCFVAFMFSFCSGEKPETVASTTASSTEPAPTAAAAAPQKKHFEASHEAPYCKLWVIKMAAVVDDPDNFKGRWFNLKRDNTFESGQWGETTNSGTWSIGKNTNIIQLAFNKEENFPLRWKIQGAGGGG